MTRHPSVSAGRRIGGHVHVHNVKVTKFERPPGPEELVKIANATIEDVEAGRV